jgi:hypothetical protein
LPSGSGSSSGQSSSKNVSRVVGRPRRATRILSRSRAFFDLPGRGRHDLAVADDPEAPERLDPQRRPSGAIELVDERRGLRRAAARAERPELGLGVDRRGATLRAADDPRDDQPVACDAERGGRPFPDRGRLVEQPARLAGIRRGERLELEPGGQARSSRRAPAATTTSAASAAARSRSPRASAIRAAPDVELHRVELPPQLERPVAQPARLLGSSRAIAPARPMHAGARAWWSAASAAARTAARTRRGRGTCRRAGRAATPRA